MHRSALLRAHVIVFSPLHNYISVRKFHLPSNLTPDGHFERLVDRIRLQNVLAKWIIL